MIKKGLLALSTVALVACGGKPDNQLEITKESFPGDWALNVDSGVLKCENKAVSFTAPDGTIYALNGFGQVYSKKNELGWQPITPESDIWLNNPEMPGIKISTSDMIEAGLALCEE